MHKRCKLKSFLSIFLAVGMILSNNTSLTYAEITSNEIGNEKVQNVEAEQEQSGEQEPSENLENREDADNASDSLQSINSLNNLNDLDNSNNSDDTDTKEELKEAKAEEDNLPEELEEGLSKEKIRKKREISDEENLTNIKSFSLDETGTIITKYKGSEAYVTIPKSINGKDIVGIHESAFSGCELLGVVFQGDSNIKTIGNNAFANNELTTVSIPSSVIEIGYGAFSHNKIETVFIGEGVKSIPRNCFLNNKIAQLTIPNNIENIEEGAFKNNNISSLSLGAVKKIGFKAFADNKLSKVNLPNTLRAYGNNVFSGNKGYVFIEGSALGKTYGNKGSFGEIVNPIEKITIKGHENTLEGKTIVEYPYYIDYTREVDDIRKYEVGNEVEIPIPAIKGYKSDEIVKVKTNSNEETVDVVYKVDKKTAGFQGLDILYVKKNEPIDLKKDVKATNSEGEDVTDLIKIAPETIDTKELGEYNIKYSFKDNGIVTTQYRKVIVGIDDENFQYADGWAYSDFLYDGGTILGFSESGKRKVASVKKLVLPSINIKTKEPILGIGDGAFSNYGIFNVVLPTNLKLIGGNVFNGNSITSLDLPSTLESIGDNSFAGNSMENVVIPSKTSTLGAGVFKNCLKLSNVEILGGLGEISDSLFENCSISHMEIPSTVTRIGNNAFRNTKLNRFVIPISVTTIGNSAFENTNLVKIDIPNTVTSIGINSFKNSNLFKLNLSEKIREIPSGAFSSNYINGIVIPDSVITIGDEAFNNKNYNSAINKGTQSISYMGKNVQSIGARAFKGDVFSVISFSAALQNVGEEAFNYTKGTSLIFDGDVSFGKDAISSAKIKNISIMNVTNISESLFSSTETERISMDPEKIESVGKYGFHVDIVRPLIKMPFPKKIKEIPISAFKNVEFTTPVVISKDIKVIGNNAFESCIIDTLIFESGEQDLVIGSYAFKNVSLKGELDLTRAIDIGNEAFQGNRIKNVRFGSKINSIGYKAFYNNEIKEVLLNTDQKIKIDKQAFSYGAKYNYAIKLTEYGDMVNIKTKNPSNFEKTINKNVIGLRYDEDYVKDVPSYYFNKKTVNAIYKYDGKEVFRDFKIYDGLSDEVTYIPEQILGYKPIENQSLIMPEDNKTIEINLVKDNSERLTNTSIEVEKLKTQKGSNELKSFYEYEPYNDKMFMIGNYNNWGAKDYIRINIRNINKDELQNVDLDDLWVKVDFFQIQIF